MECDKRQHGHQMLDVLVVCMWRMVMLESVERVWHLLELSEVCALLSRTLVVAGGMQLA